MGMKWTDIAFEPGPALAAEIAAAWQWLMPGRWTPFLCSMIGGIFAEDEDGSVYWLESGTGLVERIAADREAFETVVKSDPDSVDEWFLPPLVERLHEAGKRPGPGECYFFTILPVFAEGKYEVGNMDIVPVREQFVGAASLHEQLSRVPDGGKVRIKIVD